MTEWRWWTSVLLLLMVIGVVAASSRAPDLAIKQSRPISSSKSVAPQGDVDIGELHTAKLGGEISCQLGPLAPLHSETLIPICQIPAALSYDRANTAIRQALAAEIKTKSKNDLDYLVVFTDFDFDKGGATAFITRQKNAIQGIGQPIFGNQDDRLLGIVDMGNLSKIDLTRGSSEERAYLNVLAHEVMHAFGVYIRPDVLRGNTDAHWNFFADSDASVMYGARWRAQGQEFLAEDILHRYSPLDMYLAGFYQASEVPPIAVITGGQGSATSLPVLGYRTSGTLQYITIEQIIAENGPRIPSAMNSQKRFRAGLVLLTRNAPETLSSTLAATMVGFAGQFEQRFSAMTAGRGVFEFGYNRAQAVAAIAQSNPMPTQGLASNQIARAAQWLSQDGIGHTTQSMAASVLLFRESGLQPQALAAFSTQLRQSVPKNLDEAVWLLRVEPTHAAAMAYLQTAADSAGGYAISPYYRASPLDTSLALTVLPSSQTTLRLQALEFLSRSAVITGALQAYPLVEGGPGRINSTAQTLYALQLSARPVPIGVPNWLAARQVDELTPPGLGLPFGVYVDLLPQLEQLPVNQAASVARFQMLDTVHLLATQRDQSAAFIASVQNLLVGDPNFGSFDASPYLTAVSARTLFLSQSSNLKIIGSIRVSPTPAIDGDIIRLSATIGNDSSSPISQSFKVRWYDGSPEAGVPLGPAQTIAALNPNEMLELSASFDSRGKAGAHTFSLLVDSENTVPERTEADNLAGTELEIGAVPVPADLTPQEITVNPAAISSYPASLQITGLLRNRGATAVSNVSVALAARTSAGRVELQRLSLNAPAQSNTPFSFTQSFAPEDERRLVVVADPDNTIAEFSELNNEVPFVVEQLDGSDVEVLAGDIVANPESLIAGDTVSFTISTRNNGVNATPNLRLQASVNACKAPLAGEAMQGVQIPAGSSISRTFQLRVPAAGAFFVCAEADALNQLAESNENNNEARANFTALAPTQSNLSFVPDSIVIEPLPALEAGNLQTSIALINYGAAVASPVEIGLYKGDPASSGVLLRSVMVEGIAAGATVQVQAALSNLQARGATTIYFKADPQNQIVERDETDNTLFKEIQVLALPDLAVSTAGIRLQPSVPIVGQPVTASVSVSNLGGQTARNFEIALFENALGTGAPAAPAQSVVALAAGGRVELSFSWIFQATSNAAVSAVVDLAGSVTEVSEANNLAILNVLTQSGNQFATEPTFSPNGDGVKDATTLIFRLDESRTVDLRIVKTLTGREIRRFSGAALNAQQNIQVLWDGKDNNGHLASDGQYRAVLLDRVSSENLGLVLIELDTNRSPLLEAVDTRHAQLVDYAGLNQNGALVPPSSSPARDMVFESRVRNIAARAYPEIIRRHATTGEINIALSADWFRRMASELGWSLFNGNGSNATVRYLLSASGHELWVTVQQPPSGGNQAQFRVFALPADGYDNARSIGASYSNPGLTGADRLAALDDQTLAVFAPGVGYLLSINSAQTSNFHALPEHSTVYGHVDGVVYQSRNPLGADAEIGFLPRNTSLAPFTHAMNSQARTVVSSDKRHVLVTHALCIDACKLELIDLLERRVNVLGDANELAAFVKRDSEVVVSDVNAEVIKHFTLDGELIRLQPLASAMGEWNLVEGLGPNYETKLNDIPCQLGLAARGIVSPSGQRLVVRNYQRLRLDVQPCGFAPSQGNAGEGLSRLSEFRLRSNEVFASRPYAHWYVQDPIGLAYAPIDLRPPAYSGAQSFEFDGSFFTDETGTMADPASQISSTNFALSPQFVQLDLDAPPIRVSGSTPKFPLWPDESRALNSSDPQNLSAGRARIFSTLLNLTASLGAESTPLGVKLTGYATDANFAYFELDAALDQAPYQWQAVAPRGTEEKFGELFALYTGETAGRYVFRLTVVDEGGNRQTQYARASTEAPPSAIHLVDFDRPAFSPNGDGVKDQFHVRFQVRRQTIEKLEIFNSTNALVASQTLIYSASELGSKDLRINALEQLPDGRYTVSLAGQSSSAFVDRVAPRVNALSYSDYGVFSYEVEPDNYELIALERSPIGTASWSPVASPRNFEQREFVFKASPDEFEDQQLRVRLVDRAGNVAQTATVRARPGIDLRAIRHSEVPITTIEIRDPLQIALQKQVFPNAVLSLHFDEFSRSRMSDYVLQIAPYTEQTIAATEWTYTPVSLPEVSELSLPDAHRLLKLPLVPIDEALQTIAVRLRAKNRDGETVTSRAIAIRIRPMTQARDLYDHDGYLTEEQFTAIDAELRDSFGLLPSDQNYFFTKLATESITHLQLQMVDAFRAEPSPIYPPIYQKNGIAVFRVGAGLDPECATPQPGQLIKSYWSAHLAGKINGKTVRVDRHSPSDPPRNPPEIAARNARNGRPCVQMLRAEVKLAHERCTGESKHALTLNIWCGTQPQTVNGYRLFVFGDQRYPIAEATLNKVCTTLDEVVTQVDIEFDTSSWPERVYLPEIEIQTSDGVLHFDKIVRKDHAGDDEEIVVNNELPLLRIDTPVEGAKLCLRSETGEIQNFDFLGQALAPRSGANLKIDFGPGLKNQTLSRRLYVDSSLAKFPGNLPLDAYAAANGLQTVKFELDNVARGVCATRQFELDGQVNVANLTAQTAAFAGVSRIGYPQYRTARFRYLVDEPTQLKSWLRQATIDATGNAVITGPGSAFSALSYAAGEVAVNWDGTVAGAPVPDGLYVYDSEFIDACFNRHREQPVVIVDSTPPEIAMITPIEDATIQASTTTPIDLTVNDPRLDRWTLKHLNAPGGEALIYSNNSTGPKIWNTINLSGVQQLRLQAIDKLGNESLLNFVVTVNPVPASVLEAFTAEPALISPNADAVLDSSKLTLTLRQPARLKLVAINASGSAVETLIDNQNGAVGQTQLDWFATSLPDGVYKLKLTVTPTAGAVENAELGVVIDTTAPIISLTRPDASPGIVAATGYVRASFADAHFERASAELVAPGANLTTLRSDEVTQAGEHSLFDLHALAEGQAQLRVSARDRAGNRTLLERRFVVDGTAPEVELLSPANAAVVGTKIAPVVIVGTANDLNFKQRRISLQATNGAASVLLHSATTAVISDELFAWTPNLADGSYTLRVEAEDLAGQSSSASHAIEIDNTPPAVSISVPTAGAIVGQQLRVEGGVSDAHLRYYRIEIATPTDAANGRWTQLFRADSQPAAGAPLALLELVLADGEYVLQLSAEDVLGQKSQLSRSIKLDAEPPLAPIDLTATVIQQTHVDLRWNTVSSADVSGYRIYRDGLPLQPNLVSGTSFRDLNAPERVLRYQVHAVDQGGNQSAPSNAVTVSLDRTAPETAITQPRNGMRLRGNILVSGTAASTQEDFLEYRLKVVPTVPAGSIQTLIQSSLPVRAGQIASFDSAQFADETQLTLRLEAEDTHGNTGTSEVSITVDNLSPVAPSGLVVDATCGAAAQVTWSTQTGSDLLGYLLYRDGALVNAIGSLPEDLRPFALQASSYADQNLGDGAHTYRLYAIDQAGNVSLDSAVATASRNCGPPDLRILSPIDGHQFETSVRVLADSTDFDITGVAFSYRKLGDSSWTLVGAPVTAPPYAVQWTPTPLSYGYYEIRAVAMDSAGLVDPTPPVVQVRYADLTAPGMVNNLKARVDNDQIHLSWDASSASDLAEYRVLQNGAFLTSVSATSGAQYSLVDVLDGHYQYQVVAVDQSENISSPSSIADAYVFAPIVEVPYTPSTTSPITLQGYSSRPQTATLVRGSAVVATTELGSDGSFVFDGVVQPRGLASYLVRISDAQGNISRPARLSLGFDQFPQVPTGLAINAVGNAVRASWAANPEDNILGYRLFRNSTPVLADRAATGMSAFDRFDAPLEQVLDGDSSSYFEIPYSDVAPFVSPNYLELRLPERQIVAELELAFFDVLTRAVGFDVYARFDDQYVRIARVENNLESTRVLRLAQPYRTDRLRIVPTAVSFQAPFTVQISEVAVRVQPLISATEVNEVLQDGRYVFEVSAVNDFAFESARSSPVTLELGDVTPPPSVNLSGSLSDSNIALSWTAANAADVRFYDIYRNNVKLARVNHPLLSYVDLALRDGSYGYRVRALDQFENASPASNEVSFTVTAPGVAKPEQLRVAVVSGGNALDVSWRAGAGTAPAHYKVRRSLSATGSYAIIAAQAGTSLPERGLANGTTYWYTVEAFDVNGNGSGQTDPVPGTPRSAEAPPAAELLAPTISAKPLITRAGQIWLGGYATPGLRVDIARQSGFLARTTAAAALSTRGYNDIEPSAISPVGPWALDSTKHILLNLADNSRRIVPAGSGTFSLDGAYLYLINPTDAASSKAERVDTSTLQVTEVELGLHDLRGLWPIPGSADNSANERWLVAGVQGVGASAIDGLWLVDMDGTPSPRRIGSIVGSAVVIDTMVLSPDGRYAAYFVGDTLSVLNLQSAQVLAVGVTKRIEAPAFSSDSSVLLFTSIDGASARVSAFSLATQQSSVWYEEAGSDFSRPRFDASGTRVLLYGLSAANAPRALLLAYPSKSVLIDVPLVEPGALSWDGLGRWLQAASTSRALIPPGWFGVDAIALSPGFNGFSGVVIDDSGNASAPAPAIVVNSLQADDGQIDLAIGGTDVRFLPPAGVPGANFSASVTVRNIGNRDAPASSVALELRQPSGAVQLRRNPSIPALAAGAVHTLSVGLGPLNDSGEYRLEADVDPQALIVERSEANNNGSANALVSSDAKPTLSITSDKQVFAPLEVPSAKLRVVNPLPSFRGKVHIDIVDDAGNLIRALAPVVVPPMGFGASFNAAVRFDEPNVLAGNYRFKATLFDAQDDFVATNFAGFGIELLQNVAIALSTNQSNYGRGETLRANAMVRYTSGNASIENAELLIHVRNGQNLAVASVRRSLGSLLPGFQGQVGFNWPINNAPAGVYVVAAELIGTQQTIGAQRSVNVIENLTPAQLLLGEVTLSANPMGIGQSSVASGNVRNAGSAAITPLSARLRLLRSGELSLVHEQVVTAATPAGNTLSVPINLADLNLPLGEFVLVLEARYPTDVANQWRNLATQSLRVLDLQPPEITLVKPNKALANRSPLLVSAQIVDRHSRVERAEISIDGTQWLPLGIAADGDYGTEIAGLSDGTHQIRVRASDIFGNQAELPPSAFLIDTSAPVISITGVVQGQISNVALTPVWTATDNDLASASATLNGAPFVSGSTVAEDNSYVLVVTASDRAGNRARRSLQFVVERSAPTVAFTAPQDGAVIDAPDSPVSLRSEPHATVTLTRGAYTVSAAADDFGDVYFASVPLDFGTNTLSAAARDRAGNNSLPVAISVTRPSGIELSGSLSASAPSYPLGTAVNLSFGVVNGNSTAISALPLRLRIYRAGANTVLAERMLSVAVPAGGTSNGSESFLGSLFGISSHTASLEAQVEGSWRLLADTAFNVTDASPPVLTTVMPNANAVLGPSARFNVLASDPESEITRVEYQLDGGAWVDFGSPAGPSDSYVSGVLDAVAEGPHQFRARAFNGAGLSNQTADIGFAIDRTPPAISFSNVADAGLYNQPVRPEITITDSHATVDTIRLNGAAFVSGTEVSADGSYSLSVSSVDAAGNVSAALVRFSIDRVAPTLSFSYPLAGAVLSVDHTRVDGRTDALAEVRLEFSGASYQTRADAAGNFTVADVGPLVDGDNVFNARATDTAGNIGQSVSLRVLYRANANANLVGTLSPFNQPLAQGLNIDAEYLVRIIGSTVVSNLPLRVELYRVGSSAALETQAFVVSEILAGANTFGVRRFSPRPAGAYALVFSAQLVAPGGELIWTALDTQSLTIADTTAPVVSLLSPAADSYQRGEFSVRVRASDNVAPVRVEARVAENAWTELSVLAGQPGIYTGVVNHNLEQVTTLSARALDAAGNLSELVVQPVRIDLNPPTVEISNISANAVLTKPVTPVIVTNDFSPVVRTVTLNGQPYFGAEIGVDGDYTLQVSATDSAGHSTVLIRQFRIDRTPPTIVISYPPPGLSTQLGTVRVTGLTEANISVTLRNGSQSTVLQSDINGGFALESMALTIGSNTLTAQARDQAGNVSATASVIITRQGFVGAALSGRIDPITAQIPHDQTIALRAQLINIGSLDLTNEPLRWVAREIRSQKTLAEIPLTLTLASGVARVENQSLPTLSWPLGNVEITLETQLSQLGRAGSGVITPAWRALDRISTEIVDREPPEVRLLEPAPNALVAIGEMLRVQATDRLSAIANVEIQIDAGKFISMSQRPGSPGEFELALGEIAPGPHQLIVRAMDIYQNSAQSAAVPFRVREVLSLSVLYPTEGLLLSQAITYVEGVTKAGADVRVTVAERLYTGRADVDGRYRINGVILDPGENVLSIVASDSEGNSSRTLQRRVRLSTTVSLAVPLSWSGLYALLAALLCTGIWGARASTRGKR